MRNYIHRQWHGHRLRRGHWDRSWDRDGMPPRDRRSAVVKTAPSPAQTPLQPSRAPLSWLMTFERGAGQRIPGGNSGRPSNLCHVLIFDAAKDVQVSPLVIMTIRIALESFSVILFRVFKKVYCVSLAGGAFVQLMLVPIKVSFMGGLQLGIKSDYF